MHVVNHFSPILPILNVQIDYYTLQLYSRTLSTFIYLNDFNKPEKKHGVNCNFINPSQTVEIAAIRTFKDELEHERKGAGGAST